MAGGADPKGTNEDCQIELKLMKDVMSGEENSSISLEWRNKFDKARSTQDSETNQSEDSMSSTGTNEIFCCTVGEKYKPKFIKP